MTNTFLELFLALDRKYSNECKTDKMMDDLICRGHVFFLKVNVTRFENVLSHMALSLVNKVSNSPNNEKIRKHFWCLTN